MKNADKAADGLCRVSPESVFINLHGQKKGRARRDNQPLTSALGPRLKEVHGGVH